MMFNKFPIYIALAAVTMSSCASRKKVVQSTDNPVTTTTTPEVEVDNSANSKKNVIRNYLAANLDYQTFSGKAAASVDFPGLNYDVTANIRMEKSKKIWVSITAMFGIEAARVLITPDSVQIMNKLQRQYISKPFSYLYQFASKELTFDQVQDLFLGNVSQGLLADWKAVSEISQDGNQMQLNGKKSDLNFQYLMNANSKPSFAKIDQPNKNQKIETTYGQYDNSAGQLFPKLVEFLISGGNKQYKLALNYNQISLNSAVEMPFSVPAKYKVIQ